ncbi:hypothetical protein [Bosea rubneri]|uniref:DUF4189 domain-containing protein n=1 Tax=Bosea rubneri TaxID=3075434 RepID=A0ABU3SG66_9HYPH|nr:hypothetical protein [Bosea sp. ZW T0_25]MDU0343714.1 hypothetical protein [Bosea sp. ZW T0_25]
MKYDAAPGPKGFAKGRTKSCGYSAKTTPTIEHAQLRALQICRQQRGDDCQVVDARRH